jgi:Spy/CpxP family protein refolding chaperone
MKTYWKFLAVGFAGGLLAGVLAMHPKCFHRGGMGPGPGHGGPQKLVRMLDRKLGLTGEQKEAVEGIFAAQGVKLKALHDESFPKFEALRRATDEQVRAVLTDEQKVKYDALKKKWDERRQKWGRRPAGPPPESKGPPHRDGK